MPKGRGREREEVAADPTAAQPAAAAAPSRHRTAWSPPEFRRLERRRNSAGWNAAAPQPPIDRARIAAGSARRRRTVRPRRAHPPPRPGTPADVSPPGFDAPPGTPPGRPDLATPPPGARRLPSPPPVESLDPTPSKAPRPPHGHQIRSPTPSLPSLSVVGSDRSLPLPVEQPLA